MSFLPKKQTLMPILALSLFSLSASFANPGNEDTNAPTEITGPNPTVIQPVQPALTPGQINMRTATAAGIFVGIPALIGYATSKGPAKFRVANTIVSGAIIPLLFIGGTSSDFIYEDMYDQEGPFSRIVCGRILCPAMDYMFNKLGI